VPNADLPGQPGAGSGLIAATDNLLAQVQQHYARFAASGSGLSMMLYRRATLVPFGAPLEIPYEVLDDCHTYTIDDIALIDMGASARVAVLVRVHFLHEDAPAGQGVCKAPVPPTWHSQLQLWFVDHGADGSWSEVKRLPALQDVPDERTVLPGAQSPDTDAGPSEVVSYRSMISRSAIEPWPCGQGWLVATQDATDGLSLAHVADNGEVVTRATGQPKDGRPLIVGGAFMVAPDCAHNLATVAAPILSRAPYDAFRDAVLPPYPQREVQPDGAVETDAMYETRLQPYAQAYARAAEKLTSGLRMWTLTRDKIEARDIDFAGTGVPLAASRAGGAFHVATVDERDFVRILSVDDRGKTVATKPARPINPTAKGILPALLKFPLGSGTLGISSMASSDGRLIVAIPRGEWDLEASAIGSVAPRDLPGTPVLSTHVFGCAEP
jgi:hypothetical protein